MGWNDWADGVGIDLPPEAGVDARRGFEPDEEWLQAADVALQREVLRRWFSSRYWDPANETPYVGREGGYIYAWGGPYDASDELQSRFSGLVPDEVIDQVVEDLESEGIHEWAPIHTEPDYDEAFELLHFAKGDAFRNFSAKLTEIDALKVLDLGEGLESAMRQLLYSALIAALEAYLAETASYWVAEDKAVFRRLVEHSREFREKKVAVSDIFARMDSLKEEVEKHLQSLVWHRLDVVGPMLSAALKIDVPDIEALMRRILVRHDIVHRGGRTKEGEVVSVTSADLTALRQEVAEFVDSIERAIDVRFAPVSEDF